MPFLFTSLNSGSNGNCYYVGNRKEAVLVDVGISCREIETRMARLGLAMESIKAIFISHEHTDHIRGVRVLSKKYQLPVYITNATLNNSGIKIQPELIRSFVADEPISIGKLSIIPFIKHHDASDPHSFVIEQQGIKVGVFTDIGIVCDQLIHHFKQCHAAFLEANYDETMLDEGPYPYYLKERIRSGKGHLSNMQALELFTTHRQERLSHLILSHLSKNNNAPEIVDELFTKHSGETKVIVAPRYSETEVYAIGERVMEPEQLSLFGN
jgi:phosphoribosyl 1,2-cyclic phosphodiesterase